MNDLPDVLAGALVIMIRIKHQRKVGSAEGFFRLERHQRHQQEGSIRAKLDDLTIRKNSVRSSQKTNLQACCIEVCVHIHAVKKERHTSR